MARIKYWTNCGVCSANIAVAHGKVIGATMYCQTHYTELLKAGFDKTLGNPIEALAKLSVVSAKV